MLKHFRKWGLAFLAIVLIASTLAPSTAVAWPPGGQPIDDGEGIFGPEREAIGDPTDGGHGLPQRAIDDILVVARLLIQQLIRSNVDERVVHWPGASKHVLHARGGRSQQ